MILFAHRVTYISVIRLKSVGERPDNIGKLRLCGEWLWDTSGVDYFRSGVGYETLNGSEKCQIIGMLDDLNGVYYRPLRDMLDRWREITGLTKGAII